MGKTVIIGAGPCGLFFALKLKQAGVNNIVIADPRAGEYVRPGAVSLNTYRFVEKVLGDGRREDIDVPHIKDVERVLYKLVLEQNIHVIKKRFLRFNQNSSEIGVILADEHDIEELITCEYAFDCTGARRVLINEVNRLTNPQPFTLKPIVPDIRVPDTLIAYGLVNRQTLDAMVTRPFPNLSESIAYITNHEEYFKHVAQLRQFGWLEFAMPFIYGHSFTDEKGCLYTEAPPNLSPENKVSWINCLLNIILNDSKDHFKEMGPSKKYDHKPRVERFTFNPMEVQPFDFRGKDLPRVIALGDAQLESHYINAHGIKNGIARIILMMNYFSFQDHQIKSFNSKQYIDDNRKEWETHKAMIKEHFDERNQIFIASLSAAKMRCKQSLARTDDSNEKEKLSNLLNEIEIEEIISAWSALKEKVKLSKQESIKDLNPYVPGTAYRLNKTDAYKDMMMQEELAKKEKERKEQETHEQEMTTLFERIMEISPLIPLHTKRLKNYEIIAEIARSWKESANADFTKNQYINALNKYDHAAKLWSLVQPPRYKELLTLSSNKIICWLKQNNFVNIILEGMEQLNRFPVIDDPQMLEIKHKMLFNFVRSFKALMQNHPQTLPLAKEVIAQFIQHSLTWYAAGPKNNQLFSKKQADQNFITETIDYLKSQGLYVDAMNVDDENKDNRLSL